MTQPQGYLALVLHAHLPYVRHPEHVTFLEEDWLFEAITESYLPLLRRDGRLGAGWRSLAAGHVGDAHAGGHAAGRPAQARYVRHLDGLIALAENELRRTATGARLSPAGAHVPPAVSAGPPPRWWTSTAWTWSAASAPASGNGPPGDHRLSAATHGYLPLDAPQPDRGARPSGRRRGGVPAGLRPGPLRFLAARMRLQPARR